MQAPVRFLYSLRRGASPGVLAAALAVASMFSASPFVIPSVADRLDVALGLAGLMSTCQVGAFAIVSLVAGRSVSPGRATVVTAALIAALANLGSAVAPSFIWLLGTRLVAGGAAGALTWVAWADAMQQPAAMRSVAVIGPLTTFVMSPVFGWLVAERGDQAVFMVLALLSLPAILLPVRVLGTGRATRQRSGSRSNRVLLAALFLLTMAGSSLFIYAAAAAAELLGLSLSAAAWAYSLNAAASMVATHLNARSGTGGLWLSLTGLSAAALVLVPSTPVFYVAMALWGFGFWMGVPETFRALAARSLTPEERIGDAQSGMALGRALGPFLGGLLVGDGAFRSLGVAAAAGLLTASGTIAGVERHRSRSASRA